MVEHKPSFHTKIQARLRTHDPDSRELSREIASRQILRENYSFPGLSPLDQMKLYVAKADVHIEDIIERLVQVKILAQVLGHLYNPRP